MEAEEYAHLDEAIACKVNNFMLNIGCEKEGDSENMMKVREMKTCILQ